MRRHAPRRAQDSSYKKAWPKAPRSMKDSASEPMLLLPPIASATSSSVLGSSSPKSTATHQSLQRALLKGSCAPGADTSSAKLRFFEEKHFLLKSDRIASNFSPGARLYSTETMALEEEKARLVFISNRRKHDLRRGARVTQKLL